MYAKTFVFQKFYEKEEKVNTDSRIIEVVAGQLYQTGLGYGFVTEENRNQEELLQIAELNAGFAVIDDRNAWREATEVCADEYGCYVRNRMFPLCFKADVTRVGNYEITVKLYGKGDIYLFSGERRLSFLESLATEQEIICNFSMNVCDMIPKGKTCLYEHRSVDIAIVGEYVRLQEICIKQQKCPTLYIAGGSMATGRIAGYPYEPHNCRCGWGQMLSMYLKPGITVSNQAHEDMTTESFRTEGHYAIIQSHMKLGDYLLLQFAPNNKEGYRADLVGYVEETRAMGAYPILVTPLPQTIQIKEKENTQDEFEEYAQVCRELGTMYRVPVIDLYGKGKTLALESMDYFCPADVKETNDYGAYRLAGYIVEQYLGEFEKRKHTDAYSKLAGFMKREVMVWEPQKKTRVS